MPSRILSPGDWERRFDETTGRNFFANLTTGETSWTAPKRVARSSDEDGGFGKDDAESKDDDTSDDGRDDSTVELPAGFERALDETSGHYYYINISSGETSWEMPKERAYSKKATSEEAQDKASSGQLRRNSTIVSSTADYVKLFDGDSGQSYYYNKTQEVRWDEPEGFKESEESIEKIRRRSIARRTFDDSDIIEMQDAKTSLVFYHSNESESSTLEPPDASVQEKVEEQKVSSAPTEVVQLDKIFNNATEDSSVKQGVDSVKRTQRIMGRSLQRQKRKPKQEQQRRSKRMRTMVVMM